MDKLKLIKSIVFITTFLLVFGSLALFTIIYKKAQPQTTSYQELSLEQSTGSSIASISAHNDLLFINIKGGDKPERIVIYNISKMQKTATIYVE